MNPVPEKCRVLRFVLHDKQKQMQDIGTSQDTSIVFSEMRAAQQV